VNIHLRLKNAARQANPTATMPSEAGSGMGAGLGTAVAVNDPPHDTEAVKPSNTLYPRPQKPSPLSLKKI